MTVRISISLTDDLKRRMDKVKEDVNWSKIASDAYEKHLAEISARKAEQTMDDVIQRLRASKLESESEDYKCGQERGKRWAREIAEWKELERLAAGQGGQGDQDMSAFECAIDPDRENAVRSIWNDFWEANSGSTENPSDEFVRGFWDGAVEVYNEVGDKV